MKKLILIAFILFTAVGHAQIFAPPGAFWEYKQVVIFPLNEYIARFEYTGDTIINGQACQKVPPYIFYSDTSAIYYKSFETSGFVKIFDYNMNVGDSLYLYHMVSTHQLDCDSGFYAHIIGKGVDNIQGQNYRYITYEPVYAPFGEFSFHGGKYYEKLGFLNGFLANQTVCGLTDGYYYSCLRLYNDDSSVDTLYDNRLACPVTTGIDEISTQQFSLYPNPVVDEKFFVKSDLTVENIELINMLGQTVLFIVPVGNRVETGNMPKGIYIAKIAFANGKAAYQRVVY